MLASFVLAGEWKRLPRLPDAEGFAGSFAGVSNGALLVAGGANFPNEKPWEGGAKVWYDTVFVLENPKPKWKIAGHLPRPLGYGVSVTHNGGVVCAGGSDRERHYAEVFRLEWSNGKLTTIPLPFLPSAVANCCGALVGDMLYVAGGIDKPDSKEASNRAWSLDLRSRRPRWAKVDSWPGRGRMLAVGAGFENSFWLISGVDLTAGSDGTAQRHYLTDAFRYYPRSGWTRIADLPHPVAAAPSPAPVGNNRVYLLGGDDGSQVASSPDKHRSFGKKYLRYDRMTDRCTDGGIISAPRATLPSAFWNRAWVLPGGEVRRGIRSPEVWSWTPGRME